MVDLPRNKDGHYIDLAANIICNTSRTVEERDRRLEDYYNKIRKIYPVDTFEIETKDGKKLHFYREHYLLSLLHDKEVDSSRYHYNLYKKHWGKQKHFIATIHIDKKEKEFTIQVWYDTKYEGKGYAKAIYLSAREILEKLGIEDIEQYEIVTPVDEVTKHMKEKYGTLQDNFQGEER